MKIKLFMNMSNGIDHQIGPDLVTFGDALNLIDQARVKFQDMGIQSFEIYETRATFPFKVPADTSNPPVSSAILSTSQESSR